MAHVVRYKEQRRFVFMKLPKKSSAEKALEAMEWGYEDVAGLFADMRKKNWNWQEMNETTYNCVFVEPARDAAVTFAFLIANGLLTQDDKKHFFNVYCYIQSHPDIFTKRICWHLKNIVSLRYTWSEKQKKQIDQILLYKGLEDFYDRDESDYKEPNCYQCGGPGEYCQGECQEDCSPYLSVHDMLD